MSTLGHSFLERLERVTETASTGEWRCSLREDPVDETRFLVMSRRLDNDISPETFLLRARQATLIPDASFEPVLDFAVIDGHLHVLSQPVTFAAEQEATPGQALDQSVFALRQLQAFMRARLQVTHLSEQTIGYTASGELVLLPAAWLMPPTSPVADDDDASSGESQRLALNAMQPFLVEWADKLESVAADTAQLFRRTANEIRGGELASLSDLHLALLGRPAVTELESASSGRSPLDGAAVTAMAAIADGNCVVEIRGELGSGRSTLLRRLATALEHKGKVVRWIRPWDLVDRRRKKRGAKPAAYLIDNLDDMAYVAEDIAVNLLPSPGRGKPPTVVCTINGNDAPSAVETLKTLARARRSDTKVVSIELRPPDPVPELDMQGLPTWSRHALELLAAAHLPLPLRFVTGATPSAEDIARLNELVVTGWLDIDYARVVESRPVEPLLAIRSAKLRRQLYDGMQADRRAKLHRAVVRLAEQDSAGLPLPSWNLMLHLIAAGDDRASAYAVKFVRDTHSDLRAPHMAVLEKALGARDFMLGLSFGERMYLIGEMAAHLMRSGRADDAEKLLSLAQDLFEDASAAELHEHAQETSETLAILANAWASRGRYRRALALLTEARDSLTTYLSIAEQAKLHNAIGQLLYRLGEYDAANESIRLSLNTLSPTDHPSEVAHALNLMGVIHYNTSRYDEAIAYYQQSASLREKVGDQSKVAATYNNLALVYQAKSEYDKALNYYRRSLDLKQKQNHREGIAISYVNLARLHCDVGNYEEAERVCRDCLTISREDDFIQLMTEAYGTLGDVEFERGNLDNACDNYQRALSVATDLGMANEELSSHRRLARLYLTRGDNKAARASLGRADELIAQLGSRLEAAEVHAIRGELHLAEGNDADAIAAFESATAGFASLARLRQAATMLGRVGNIHARGGNSLKARQYLDRSMDLLRGQIGVEIPEEVLALQQTVRDTATTPRTIRTDASQRLLYAFYELGAISDLVHDTNAYFQRAIELIGDLVPVQSAQIAVGDGEGGFTLYAHDSEPESVESASLRGAFTKTMETGIVLDSAGVELGDLANHVPGSGFVCAPIRSASKGFGCVLLEVNRDDLPPSGDTVTLLTAVCRHLAADVRLMGRADASAVSPASSPATASKEVDGRPRGMEEMIGTDDSMRRVFSTIEKVKDMDAGLLIIGESGTGKTQLAHTVHLNSPRRNHPFQQIHCAEIPVNLLESELFGHEKGAFTGAAQRKRGRCEIADRGTVFLDDVNVMPMETQTKLLRYLETKSFYRLGGTEKIKTDVRIIAASNENLETLVKRGKFREDLYYRLKVILVQLPPLRQRRDDVIKIAQSFLQKRCNVHNKPLKTLSPETIRLFQTAPWPGNVRELQNVIEQIVLLCDDDIVEPSGLPEDFLRRLNKGSTAVSESLEALAQRIVESDDYSDAQPLMPQLEKLLAREMTRHVDNKGKAASLLGITKPTLYNRLRKWDRQ